MPSPRWLQALQQELGFDPEDPEFDLGAEGDSWRPMGAGSARPGAAASSPYAVRDMLAMEQALQRQLDAEEVEGQAAGQAAGGGRSAAFGASTGRPGKDVDDKIA